MTVQEEKKTIHLKEQTVQCKQDKSKGNLECSIVQEEHIQIPPEDTELEKMRGSEDSLVELEILQIYSLRLRHWWFRLRRLNTKLHLLEWKYFHVLQPQWQSHCWFRWLLDSLYPIRWKHGQLSFQWQNHFWFSLKNLNNKLHLIRRKKRKRFRKNLNISLPCLSTVDKPLAIQKAPAKVEQERLPERRRSRRTKQERKTRPFNYKMSRCESTTRQNLLAWTSALHTILNNTKLLKSIRERMKWL